MKAEVKPKRLAALAVESGNVPWPIAVSFLIRPLPEEFFVVRLLGEWCYVC